MLAPTSDGGASWVDSGDRNAVAPTRSGVLLLGTNALVRERVASSWRTPPHAAGSNLGNRL